MALRSFQKLTFALHLPLYFLKIRLTKGNLETPLVVKGCVRSLYHHCSPCFWGRGCGRLEHHAHHDSRDRDRQCALWCRRLEHHADRDSKDRDRQGALWCRLSYNRLVVCSSVCKPYLLPFLRLPTKTFSASSRNGYSTFRQTPCTLSHRRQRAAQP